MKHVYTFLFFLLLAHGAAAQKAAQQAAALAPAPGAELPHYTHVIDSVTQALDRVTGLGSGILYDRVMPLAGLHAFTPADTSSARHFRQAYLELYTAAYSPGRRTRPAYVRERADYLARRDSVPLAVFDAAFHLLDTLALQDNLLSEQSGLLHDVPGRSRSPFVARELVLAAALADTVLPSARFYFAPELALSTRGRAVSGLLVDFDNQQGAVPCLPGQALTVGYGTPGPKVLHFTVYFTDGTQAQARARLYVRAAPATKPSLPLTGSISTVEAKVPFTDYASRPVGPSGVFVRFSLYGVGETLTVLHHTDSQAEYTANPNDPNSYKLRRPVIFVDGFDAQDKRRLFNP